MAAKNAMGLSIEDRSYLTQDAIDWEKKTMLKLIRIWMND